MGLLTILYRDDDLVAIDKPDGLLVHRTRIARDHVVVLQLLRDQVNRLVYPVHRLDRPTSGVLVLAFSPETAARLAAAWASGAVRKRYIAVVRGYPDEQGTIDRPLRDADGGGIEQPAVTRYRRLATAELDVAIGPNPTARYALVEAVPETGRTHQLRRHFRHIAHPVIGDTQHGDTHHNRFFRDRFGVHRMLLHAAKVALPHPATGNPLVIRAPLPADFARAFAHLGWHADVAEAGT